MYDQLLCVCIMRYYQAVFALLFASGSVAVQGPSCCLKNYLKNHPATTGGSDDPTGGDRPRLKLNCECDDSHLTNGLQDGSGISVTTQRKYGGGGFGGRYSGMFSNGGYKSKIGMPQPSSGIGGLPGSTGSGGIGGLPGSSGAGGIGGLPSSGIGGLSGTHGTGGVGGLPGSGIGGVGVAGGQYGTGSGLGSTGSFATPGIGGGQFSTTGTGGSYGFGGSGSGIKGPSGSFGSPGMGGLGGHYGFGTNATGYMGPGGVGTHMGSKGGIGGPYGTMGGSYGTSISGGSGGYGTMGSGTGTGGYYGSKGHGSPLGPSGVGGLGPYTGLKGTNNPYGTNAYGGMGGGGMYGTHGGKHPNDVLAGGHKPHAHFHTGSPGCPDAFFIFVNVTHPLRKLVCVSVRNPNAMVGLDVAHLQCEPPFYTFMNASDPTKRVICMAITVTPVAGILTVGGLGFDFTWPWNHFKPQDQGYHWLGQHGPVPPRGFNIKDLDVEVALPGKNF